MRTMVMLALLLAAATASAQTPGIPPPPLERDLFAAADAFAPRYDRIMTPGELGIWLPYPVAVGPVWPPPPPPPVVVVVVPPPQATAAPAAPTPPATPQQPPAQPAARPGEAKTIYVIPNCYAGDKRPRPDQLRPGCRMSDLRIISPDR